MKYIIYPVLFLLPALSLYCQHPVKSIDSLLRTYYKAGVPGATVLISKNQQTLFKKSYGLARLNAKEKMSSNTLLNIGSLTKQFTAFCIVQLVEQKKCSLQDKLIQYFPDFAAKTGNLVTIQQLLTHSSGIIDHYAFTDTRVVAHATDNDVLNAIKKIDSTYFIPGTKYRYSNTAYCLLALIIEKISGMQYNDYVKKNIFAPLTMQHSLVLDTRKPVANSAYGYAFDSSKNSFTKLDAAESVFFSTEGDGGIYTSATEYLKWWQFLQQPTPGNRRVAEKARSPQFSIDSLRQLSYGYGWFINGKAVYHTGSNGGFRALVFSIPSARYMLLIFSNRTDIDLEKLAQQINDILHVTNNSFIKTAAFVSFIHSSPIFAPCKEII